MIITREQGQSMVVDLYQKKHALACYYCTGFGKAKAALDAIKADPMNKEHDAWGLIVCHMENARDKTWPKEIDQWLTPYEQRGDIDLCCYQSLSKYAHRHYSWIVLDEAHYITPGYMEHLSRIRYDGIIVMTGTQPEDLVKMQYLQRLSRGNTLEIALDTAVNSKILNDYRVRIWKVGLSPSEWQEYLTLSKRIKDAMIHNNQFMVKRYGGDRMRFIYNLETKYKAAAWLKDQIKGAGKRLAIFCGSIEMCNRLSPYRKHSQTDDSDYERFCNMEIDEIASIKEIKEGANIQRLEACLVEQLNSKQHNLLQILGRAMRLEPHETAYMHVLVAKNTVDENWCEKSIKSLNKSKITYHEIDREQILNYE